MANADKLELELDDIIQMNRSKNRRGNANREFAGRRGRGNMNGFRTGSGGGGRTPLVTEQSMSGRWKHDLFERNTNINQQKQRNTSVNSATKLLISNLDSGVTSDDITELFEDIGAIRVARVHYDENGQSLGTAEVIYERRVDAIAALQKYNYVNLDDRPMEITIVENIDVRSNPQRNRLPVVNRYNNTNRRSVGQNKIQQNNRRGNQGRGDRQRNRTMEKQNVTADDLDAELDAYRAEGKQAK